MTTRDALTLWRKEVQLRMAAEVLERILATVADAEDAAIRLADLGAQIATAERTLAEVRASAEQENSQRRERITAARAGIERAEREAQERIQAVEREEARRLAVVRGEHETALVNERRQAHQDLVAIRGDVVSERGVLSQLRAETERIRSELRSLLTIPKG